MALEIKKLFRRNKEHALDVSGAKEARKPREIRLLKLSIFMIMILLPVMVLLLSTYFTFYNENLHKYEFSKTGVYDKVSNADAIMHEMMNYFQWKGTLDRVPFTENEKSHLADVKVVLGWSYLAFFVAIILFLISLMIALEEKELIPILYSLFFGSVITIGIMIAALMVNFDLLFTTFHQLIFIKGNWAFPETSLMIQMFSQQFFYEEAKRIFFGAVIISLIVLISSRVMIYMHKAGQWASHLLKDNIDKIKTKVKKKEQ